MLDSGDAEYRWKDNRSRDSEEKEPTHLPLFICYFSFSFLIYTTKQSLSRMLASDSSSCALWETAALSHLMLLEGLFPLVPCMGKSSCCEWGPWRALCSRIKWHLELGSNGRVGLPSESKEVGIINYFMHVYSLLL